MLMNKGFINKIYNELLSSEDILLAYDLLKIYKSGCSLRLIGFWVNNPLHNLANYIQKIICKSILDPSHIKK
jgi:hypothetical protein